MYLEMLKKFGHVVLESESQESIVKFSMALVPLLKYAIKDRLYKESPLRNDFQVRPLDGSELPIFYGGPSYMVGDDAGTVLNVTGEKVCVILYETCCNPEITYGTLMRKTIHEAFDMYLKTASDNMLAEETRIHGLVKGYEGRGIFIIRTDVQVIVANDYNHKKMGFSIFENVGVVKIGRGSGNDLTCRSY